MKKKVAMFCDFKFEDLEVMYPKIRLEEEGVQVDVIGIHQKGMKYTGKFGYPIKSDMCVDDFDSKDYYGVILPGGFAPDYMRRSKKMLSAVVEMFEAGKPIAAICHGPWMMCSARKSNGDTILKGRRATSFHAVKDDVINAGATYVSDESCVVDGNLITAQTPADLTPFCKAFLNQLKKKRKVVHLTDGKTAKLANWGQRAGCDTGSSDCQASGKKLLDPTLNNGTKVGVWECTKGGFPVVDRATTETCFILDGQAKISSKDDGSSVVVKAGDTIVLPKGWTGRWDIQSKSLRKVYVVSED